MIEGKVARILNNRELVINRGRQHGVLEGMRFEVLDPKGEDVLDPDTGEILGSAQRPKVRVRAVQVEDRLTVARTYESWRVNVGGTGALYPSGVFDVARALAPPRYETRYKTLATTEETWESLDESERYIKTGDPVRQVQTAEEPKPEP
jgi:hypothetical protein